MDSITIVFEGFLHGAVRYAVEDMFHVPLLASRERSDGAVGGLCPGLLEITTCFLELTAGVVEFRSVEEPRRASHGDLGEAEGLILCLASWYSTRSTRDN